MKRKNKKKHLKFSHIMVLFVTFLICISISYCKLSTNLKISGSVNASLPMGNSQYTVEHRSSWPSTAGHTIHDVHLCVLNLDEDFTDSLVVTFNINKGFNLEASSNNLNVWQADSITQNGNTVKIVMKQYAAWLQVGSKLDLYFQLPYDNENSIPEITSVTIGGYRAQYVQEF